MNDQAFCAECHSPLTADAVKGLCPECLTRRRIYGSDRRVGWLFVLLGGGWTLLWSVATVWCIIQANLEPGAGGEFAGYAVMGVMMMAPGLAMTLVGVKLARTSPKPTVVDNGRSGTPSSEVEAGSNPKAHSLTVTALVLGLLSLMLPLQPILSPAAVICGILALRTSGIDSRDRAMAKAGIVLGAVWVALALFHLVNRLVM